MREFCELANPNEDIGYLIWRVSKFWQRGKQRILKEFDVTGPQIEIMGAIYHMTNMQIEVTQIILSQETDVDPMTTSTILRNLQKKNLISRRESETDTRARIVELTDYGSDVFLKAVSKLKNSQNKLFQNIDINEETIKTHLLVLLETLEKIEKSDKESN